MMKNFTRRTLIAAAPVFGAIFSIALLQAAQLPFPPQLALDALPQWAVFCAVVYTATELFTALASRLLPEMGSSA